MVASSLRPILSGIASGALVITSASGCSLLTTDGTASPPAADSAAPAETTPEAPVAASEPAPDPVPTPVPAPTPVPTPPPAPTPTTPAARLSWEETAAEVTSGVARIQTVTCEGVGTGTGFLIDEDLLVTAAHVVAGASTINIVLPEALVGAQVLGINEAADLALLRTHSDVPGHVFSFEESQPALGEEVAAFGFPPAGGQGLSLSKGIVSGLDRTIDFGFGDIGNMIQTDATVNKGNSGGPLLSIDGTVVGVVSAEASAPNDGIGFAVTAARASDAANEWQVRNVPVAPASCGNAQGPGTMPTSVQSDHDQALNIAQSLQLHGQAINLAAYETAYEIFTPEMQAEMVSVNEWSNGLGSTFWTMLAVHDVTGTGDALTAEVFFRTEQGAEDGYAGQTCSDWHMSYAMVWDGLSWRIGGAQPETDPTPCY